MHTKRSKLILAVAVIIILATIPTVSAKLITGPTVITKPGVYVVNQNFINSTASTFICVESSNVIIEGNGHLIDGIGNSNSYGIYVYSSTKTLTNVTIKDLRLSNWRESVVLNNIENSSITNVVTYNNSNWAGVEGTGISIVCSSNNNLTNITARNNWDGVYIFNSKSNRLTDIATHNNRHAGIDIVHSLNNSLTRITSFDDIRIYNSLNNSLTYVSIYNSDGIYVYDSSNNYLAGVRIYNNFDGIDMVNSSDNYLSNITICNSWNNGIHMDNSSNNCLTNIASYNNRWAGIDMFSSSNNNLTNVDVCKNHVDGICMKYSSNNSLTNCAIHNNWYGIEIWNSMNNVLTDTAIYGNKYGIALHHSSYNSLVNNIIKYNTYGINLVDSFGNIIYNNYFNNTDNVRFIVHVVRTYINKWNITKTPGKNIVGGPYIAGNYWATPNGTGFSQVTPDKNGDGICDSPYNITTNNTDYLPLTKPKSFFNPINYDINHNKRIDFSELLKAIEDWINGKISFKELKEVIVVWIK